MAQYFEVNRNEKNEAIQKVRSLLMQLSDNPKNSGFCDTEDETEELLSNLIGLSDIAEKATEKVKNYFEREFILYPVPVLKDSFLHELFNHCQYVANSNNDDDIVELTNDLTKLSEVCRQGLELVKNYKRHEED